MEACTSGGREGVLGQGPHPHSQLASSRLPRPSKGQAACRLAGWLAGNQQDALALQGLDNPTVRGVHDGVFMAVELMKVYQSTVGHPHGQTLSSSRSHSWTNPLLSSRSILPRRVRALTLQQVCMCLKFQSAYEGSP